MIWFEGKPTGYPLNMVLSCKFNPNNPAPDSAGIRHRHARSRAWRHGRAREWLGFFAATSSYNMLQPNLQILYIP